MDAIEAWHEKVQIEVIVNIDDLKRHGQRIGEIVEGIKHAMAKGVVNGYQTYTCGRKAHVVIRREGPGACPNMKINIATSGRRPP